MPRKRRGNWAAVIDKLPKAAVQIVDLAQGIFKSKQE